MFANVWSFQRQSNQSLDSPLMSNQSLDSPLMSNQSLDSPLMSNQSLDSLLTSNQRAGGVDSLLTSNQSEALALAGSGSGWREQCNPVTGHVETTVT